MNKIFIDGKAGTTGLRIYERLESRDDIEIITLSEEDRKDPIARKKALNAADIVFLCLPDAAAIDAVSMIENKDTVVIDTSTAHRTDPDWAYGFPELGAEFESKIKNSKRIAVPGCHAGGFIALVYPLVENGVIAKDELLTCHSITGYSGGGKKMIEQYQSDDRCKLLDAPRQYGVTQKHKHLKEMKAISNIENEPIFCPIVADFYSGMEVTVPIFAKKLCNNNNIDTIKSIYKNKYNSAIVSFKDDADEDGFLSAAALSGKDRMEISVLGNEDRMILVARYDNLGKGASGAAIECLNIVLGQDKTKCLEL